jgi:hypothetical protein
MKNEARHAVCFLYNKSVAVVGEKRECVRISERFQGCLLYPNQFLDYRSRLQGHYIQYVSAETVKKRLILRNGDLAASIESIDGRGDLPGCG